MNTENETLAKGYDLCFNALTKAVDSVLFEANREKEVIPFEIISQISDKMKELQLEH